MRIILNQNLSHMLESINPSKSERILRSAMLLIQYAKVYVELVDIVDDVVTLSAIQKFNPNDNYLDEVSLANRIKETFQKYTDKEVVVKATAYSEFN